MSLASVSASTDLQLRALTCHPPFEAALIPVPAFPVPRARLGPIGTLLDAMAVVLTRKYRLQQEAFYQSWKLSPANGADLIRDHLSDWSPDLGLGVWPDREPPTGWTEERMVNAAAACFRGDEPDIPNREVLRNTAEADQIGKAAQAMRGFGVQIETYASSTFAEIQANARRTLLPPIADRRFRSADFYLPLLDATSVERAFASNSLQTWMCGVDVYVRESAEDKGVLLISAIPLEQLLSEVQKELFQDRI